MKSILISINPKWCELIASGKKTVEVRKTKPKLETPFKVYIYCTANKQGGNDLLEIHGTDGKIRKGNSKVIGEFICDEILDCRDVNMDDTCLTVEEWLKYTKGHKGVVYGWHISNLVIYDKPKELSEFKKINRDCWYADLGLAKRDCPECKNADCFVTKPPQSWCYLESEVSE